MTARGWYLVPDRTPANEEQRVVDILDQDGSVDPDKRSEFRSAEGWTSGIYTTTSTQVTARSYASGTIDVDKEIDVGTKTARETETVTGTVPNKEVDFHNDRSELESRGTIDQKV